MQSASIVNDDETNSTPLRPKRPVPDGLWVKCENCNATVFGKKVDENLGLCPECGHQFEVDTGGDLGES